MEILKYVIAAIVVIAVIVLLKRLFGSKPSIEDRASVWGESPSISLEPDSRRDRFGPDASFQAQPQPHETFVAEPAQDPAELEAELRRDLVAATTPAECYDVYRDTDSGSQLEREAEQKYVQLVRQEVTAATTGEDIWAAIDGLEDIDGIKAVKSEAFDKLLNLATTTQEAMDVYAELDSEDERNDKALAAAIALAKSGEDVNLVDNELYEEDAELVRAAFTKRLEFVTTLEAASDLIGEYDIGDDEWKLAVQHAAALVQSGAPVSDE